MNAAADVCLNCKRAACLLDIRDDCPILLNCKKEAAKARAVKSYYRDPEESRRKARERYYVKRDGSLSASSVAKKK